MAFVFLIIGAVLLTASVRNTQDTLFDLVRAEFTTKPDQPNFFYWFLAILAIGSIGYIPKAKGIATAFITLVIIVLVLSKGDPKTAGGGFFEKFTKQIQPADIKVSPGGTLTNNPLTPVENKVDLSLPTNMFPNLTIQ